jgi:hypothetical protein
VPLNDREKTIVVHRMSDKNGAVDLHAIARFFAVCGRAPRLRRVLR